jgi:hypothetical protein
LIELKRLGAQVVTINAELLHFHSTPPASESSVGGIDLIGAKSAAQANVRNTTMSKGRFIAVLPSSGLCRFAAFFYLSFDQEALLSGVGFSFSSRTRKMASLSGRIVSWPHGRRSLFTRSRPMSPCGTEPT